MLYFLLFILNVISAYNFNPHYIGKSFSNNDKNSLNNVYYLINQNRCYGYLSTLSYSNKLLGFPYSSLVGISVDNQGCPILMMSDISQHTKNINKNNSISLLIQKVGLIDQSEKRVTFTGSINKINDIEEINDLKKIYKESHDNAYWLDYIDFSIYRLNEIKDINYVGGFGKATKIGKKKYFEKFIKK